jgi:hypothetical protein
MVSRLTKKMHWSFEMTTQTSGIRPLTDTEIDDVNGGFLFLLAAGAYLVYVGAVAGYYATEAIIN